MKNSNLTKKQQLQQITFLFLAMTMGQLMLFGVLWFVFGATESKGAQTIAWIIPSIVLMAVFASYFIYRQRLSTKKELNSMEEKIMHYRTSKIVQWAIMEGGNLIALVFYFFVESDMKILLAFGFGLMVFSFYRPTIQDFANDYGLDTQETNELLK